LFSFPISDRSPAVIEIYCVFYCVLNEIYSYTYFIIKYSLFESFDLLYFESFNYIIFNVTLLQELFLTNKLFSIVVSFYKLDRSDRPFRCLNENSIERLKNSH
jgi:hypothetical protein